MYVVQHSHQIQKEEEEVKEESYSCTGKKQRLKKALVSKESTLRSLWESIAEDKSDAKHF